MSDDADAEADGDPDAVDGDAVEAVDPEEVRHVADLARVDLAEDDVDRFTEQFADILASFEALDEVPEIEREAELANVMRPDEEREGLSQDEALANAPETEDGYFKGPRVS
jgi:aspartyl-tRNA(Asn)/glutamyl-tRNA(Gln) amidotransferase subunit C